MRAPAMPTFAFLFRHPANFIALGFGAGLAPAAPGTFGTLVAIPIATSLRAHLAGVVFVAAGYTLVVLALGQRLVR